MLTRRAGRFHGQAPLVPLWSLLGRSLVDQVEWGHEPWVGSATAGVTTTYAVNELPSDGGRDHRAESVRTNPQDRRHAHGAAWQASARRHLAAGTPGVLRASPGDRPPCVTNSSWSPNCSVHLPLNANKAREVVLHAIPGMSRFVMALAHLPRSTVCPSGATGRRGWPDRRARLCPHVRHRSVLPVP